MRKLNNKGFAISTILYGLLIVMVLLMGLLMSTMSFARTNSKKFVNEIIDSIEYRDLNPPVVTISSDTKTLYTKNNYNDLQVIFKVTDENYIDLHINYTVEMYIGGIFAKEVSCIGERKSDNEGEIICPLNFDTDNLYKGEVKLVSPKVYDSFNNSNNSEQMKTGYVFEDDTEAPTFSLYSAKPTGEFYTQTAYDFTIKIKLCDNSGTFNPVSPPGSSFPNSGLIKIGNTPIKNNLPIINNSNNQNDETTGCLIIPISVSVDQTNSSTGELTISIPGKESGTQYGWGDTSGNINSETQISTGITFINKENSMAIHLSGSNASDIGEILYTKKAYKIQGEIGIESSCSSGTISTDYTTKGSCIIGNSIIDDCSFGLSGTTFDFSNGGRFSYTMNVKSSNTNTGEVAIIVPANLIKDCNGNGNKEVTIYTGQKFVKE